MNIGIFGAGRVGSALAKAWAARGHRIKVTNAHNAGRLEQLLAQTCPTVTSGDAVTVARFGEVLLLAVPYREAAGLLETAGDLTGKIIIDCTNPVKADYSGLEIGLTTSAAEEIAARFPGARVVKAYSTVPAALVGTLRDRLPAPPFLFYCGDDALAKKVVARLIEDSGFAPLDAGPLSTARSLEPLVLLYAGLGRGKAGNPPGLLTLVPC